MVAWESIVRVYWYNSSIGITLDTVSLIVTKYNNTAITRTSTMYGDIDSVNVSSVGEVQSIVTSLAQAVDDNDYNLFVGALLGNATKGSVDASEPPAYPTPYLAIDGFQYISLSSQVDGCPLAERDSSYTCSCPMESIAYAWVARGEPSYQTMPLVSLTATYYETLNPVPTDNLVGAMGNDFGQLNNESFLDFLSSASVFESYPRLSSCAVFTGFNGPPQVIIPAFALTTTVATTIVDSGIYRSSRPQPASPVMPTPLAPQTASTLPTVQTIQAAPIPVPNRVSATPTPSSPEAPPSSPTILSSPGSLPAGEPPGNSGQQPPSQGLTPVLTLGGSTYTADEAMNIVLPSHTLLPGSPVATIGNTPISIAPGGLAAVIGTSTQILATLPSLAVLTFDGSAYTADASSDFILAGTTLKAGGNPVVIAETTVSLVPGGAVAVVGTHTQVLDGISPAQGSSNTVYNAPNLVTATPILTLEGSTYTADAASNFVIAGQTVAPGGVLTVSGTPISIALGASLAVIGSSTQSLVRPVTTQKPVLTFAGSVYTAGRSSDFLINGQTLTKGGTINVGGTQLSLDQAGTNVIIGTSTQQLNTAVVTTIAKPVFTFDGYTYTAGPSSDFVIDGKTLSRGGAINVDGTRISYDQDGTEVIIGTSTQKLGTASITVAETPAITFDGSTYYLDSASHYVIDGQTLTRGGVIYVNGTKLSYAQGGTDVVIGTSTEAVGLGGYILSGFGGESSTTLPVEFTGKAVRRNRGAGVLRVIGLGLVLCVGV